MARGGPAVPQSAVLKFLQPDPAMWRRAVAALAQSGLTATYSDSLTAPGPVAVSGEKGELHRRYGAATVNMEDYWAARLCGDAKVPFLAVRAALDTAGQDLPSYLMGLTGKRGRAAAVAASHPWRAPVMLRMARQMRLAQESLARFALAFVDWRQNSVAAGDGAAP